MKTWLKRSLPYAAVVLATASATLFVVRARAAGIPDADVLTYTGYLEDGDGAPLTGDHSIAVRFWAAAEGGSDLCTGELASVEVQAGRFQVPLPQDCVDAVRANPDLFVDVVVDGATLGRTKLGAVPYALEAGRASDSAGLLEERLAALEERVGDRSSVRATMSANQSVGESTWAKVKFDTPTWDEESEFDAATNSFVAKQAGLYLVTCSIRFEPTVCCTGTNAWWNVSIQVGDEQVGQDGHYGDGWTAFRNATTTVRLEAGDTVSCLANHQTSGSAKTVDKGGSHFEVTRLDSTN